MIGGIALITSIVLTGCHNIGVNNNNKIKIDDNIIAMKEIPFVRYRFNSYGESEIKFIERNMKRFVGPVHMAEIPLSVNTNTEAEALDGLGNIVKFLYIDVTDSDIENGFSADTIDLLENLGDAYFDRYMLKDKSSQMYQIAADRLKDQIADILDVEPEEIGVCGSPISFRGSEGEIGQACLTAVKARELLAEYSENVDLVPSANHECMDCCGCIRYIVVEHDIPAMANKQTKSTKTNKDSSSSENGKELSNSDGKKSGKASKIKGFALPKYF